MTTIESVTLEVPDLPAATAFYSAAFGLSPRVHLRASRAPTTGFRGFTLSLAVSQPATVSDLVAAALNAGATPLKSARRQFWGGYSGVVRGFTDPDGFAWETAPQPRAIEAESIALG